MVVSDIKIFLKKKNKASVAKVILNFRKIERTTSQIKTE